MAKQKKKLLILFAIQFVIIFVHNILDTQSLPDYNWKSVEWHYWLGMGFGAYIFTYILARKCGRCKKPQIMTGPAIAQWRWPDDTCWNCGEIIN